MTKPLNLYRWYDVLSDWTQGGVAVVARSLEDAKTAILAEDATAHSVMFGDGREPPCEVTPLNRGTKATAFVVWGGG